MIAKKKIKLIYKYYYKTQYNFKTIIPHDIIEKNIKSNFFCFFNHKTNID